MRVSVLFLAYLSLPCLSLAQTSLSLHQAIESALRQNPSVSAARHSVEEADARIRQARAGYYPQAGFNGIAKVGLSGATNALGLVGLPASPLYRNFADSLNVTQTLFDSGRIKHQIASERKLRDAAEAEVGTVEAVVTLEVERAYYGVLRARRLLDLSAEVIRTREATVRQAQAFYEGQIRSRVDLDLARVNLTRARIQAAEADNQVRITMAKLGQALGGSQDEEYLLEPAEPGVPEMKPLESLIQEAPRMRPELQALRSERAAAEEHLEYARSQRKPFLNLAFSGGYARFTDILARELLAGGAGLALPLFTGGRIEGQEQEAEARLRVLDSQDESLRQQVALEVRTAWFGLKKAVEALPALRESTEYARSALRLADERYKERLGSFVDELAAQSAEEEASSGEAVGLYDAKIAEAELRRAVGRR